MKTNSILEYKLISDILWHDGPLLSFGITNEELPVLEIWCNDYIYAYAFLNEKYVAPFLNAEISYFNALKNCDEIVLLKYSKEHDNPIFEPINNIAFIENYGPTEKADLTDDLVYFRDDVKKLIEYKSISFNNNKLTQIFKNI